MLAEFLSEAMVSADEPLVVRCKSLERRIAELAFWRVGPNTPDATDRIFQAESATLGELLEVRRQLAARSLGRADAH